jgi:hypothetical protein
VVVPIEYTIDNTADLGAQKLGVVTASVSTIDQTTAGALAGPCTAADFTFAAGGSAVGTVADNSTFTSSVGNEPSIQMKETGLNQDGCQGATVHLSLSAAQGA